MNVKRSTNKYSCSFCCRAGVHLPPLYYSIPFVFGGSKPPPYNDNFVFIVLIIDLVFAYIFWTVGDAGPYKHIFLCILSTYCLTSFEA